MKENDKIKQLTAGFQPDPGNCTNDSSNRLKEMNEKLEGLNYVLDLEHRIIKAGDRKEKANLLVNKTHKIAPNRQVILFSIKRQHLVIEAISNIPIIDTNAPMVMWLQQLGIYCKQKFSTEQKIKMIASYDLNERLYREWTEWGAPHAYWYPLITSDEKLVGGMLIQSDRLWSNIETTHIKHVLDTYIHSLSQAQPKRHHWKHYVERKKFAITSLAAASIIGVCAIPVPLSVVVPMEVAPIHPTVMTAPSEGKVSNVFVEPNSHVKKGDALFQMDSLEKQHDALLAKQQLHHSDMKYRQQIYRSLTEDDPHSNAELRILALEIKKDQSKVTYLNNIANEQIVRAPHDGIVLFDNIASIQGKPVSTGEDIMKVVDPRQVVIHAYMNIHNTIPLKRGNDAKIFFNNRPFSNSTAHIDSINYEAQEFETSQYAYRVTLHLDESDQEISVGQKGKATLHGENVPLIWDMIRRPILYVKDLFEG